MIFFVSSYDDYVVDVCEKCCGPFVSLECSWLVLRIWSQLFPDLRASKQSSMCLRV
jgi:hypothetical protein